MLHHWEKHWIKWDIYRTKNRHCFHALLFPILFFYWVFLILNVPKPLCNELYLCICWCPIDNLIRLLLLWVSGSLLNLKCYKNLIGAVTVKKKRQQFLPRDKSLSFDMHHQGGHDRRVEMWVAWHSVGGSSSLWACGFKLESQALNPELLKWSWVTAAAQQRTGKHLPTKSKPNDGEKLNIICYLMPSISFPYSFQSPPPPLQPTQYFTSCLNLSLRPSRRVQTARGEGECIHMSLMTQAAVSSSHSVFLFHDVSFCPFSFNNFLSKNVWDLSFSILFCSVYDQYSICRPRQQVLDVYQWRNSIILEHISRLKTENLLISFFWILNSCLSWVKWKHKWIGINMNKMCRLLQCIFFVYWEKDSCTVLLTVDLSAMKYKNPSALSTYCNTRVIRCFYFKAVISFDQDKKIIISQLKNI